MFAKTAGPSLLAIFLMACPPLLAHAADDLAQARRDAEARAAIAEARRAALLASLPSATSAALAGSVELKQFNAAGLVKAFDLARQLAGEVCTALPVDRKTVVYEPAAAQGVLAARLVQDALARLAEDLGRRNKELQGIIDTHTPQGSQLGSLVLGALTVIPATLTAAADVTALFRSDVGVAGTGYGEGARSLFVSALGQHCPGKLAGLGSGYLGELDGKQYDTLLGKVRGLGAQRGELANRIAIVQKLADAAKGDDKRELAALAAGAAVLLKTVDAFIDSLAAGEVGERSPLFNTARYLAYATRTRDTLVLDFDLRLEGMTIVKESLFTGQRLRLSGVAFLWYRLHAPDGTLLAADTVRRMTAPVEVDLRGEAADGEFWRSP